MLFYNFYNLFILIVSCFFPIPKSLSTQYCGIHSHFPIVKKCLILIISVCFSAEEIHNSLLIEEETIIENNQFSKLEAFISDTYLID